MSYRNEVIKAMEMLARDERVIFLGQSVRYSGNAIYKTLLNVPLAKKLELPVFEDTQLGMSIGLVLEGYIPVSTFPRMDFLIIAANQLVNHLDKIEEISRGQYKPKVIIRTMLGSIKPLYPGPQHCQDHTEALRCLVTNIDVVKLTESRDIVPAYEAALQSQRSSILIEMADLY